MFDKIKNYLRKCKTFGEINAPGEKGQALNTVLSLVIAGVALVIGVYVFGEVEGSMDYESGSHIDNIVSDLFLYSSFCIEGIWSLWDDTNSPHRISSRSYNCSINPF